MNDQEIIREFLIESAENLGRLDQQMLELEKSPERADLIADIFRTIHTIKGTCGFFGFHRLETLSHAVENILGDLRERERVADPQLITLLLEAIDAIKRILGHIEASGAEGDAFEQAVLDRLQRVRQQPPSEPSPATPVEMLAAPAPAPSPTETANQTLRVDVGLLDQLMNMVGELVLTRNQLLQYGASREDAALAVLTQRLDLITSELQHRIMKTRMQPIGIIWNRFPRVVRDLSATLSKEIVLEMEGADTDLDRNIIEAIKDPLTHLLRNSCDHGIETPDERERLSKSRRGKISLRAFHAGGQVNIEINDDGTGIDPERVRVKAVEKGLIAKDQAKKLSSHELIQLVFEPGFSTAKAVTSLSGRGVGMDVVRTHVERIGGSIELSSAPAAGTSVRLKIPLTLAIIPGLITTVASQPFVIPQTSLQELLHLEGDGLKALDHVHEQRVLHRRGRLLPVVDLAGVLRLPSSPAAEDLWLAVVQADGLEFCLVVDTIQDTQEIVVKPIGQQLKALRCYAGATVLGDGRIALILDVAGLAQHSGLLDSSRGRSTSLRAAEVAAQDKKRKRLALVRAGEFERLAIPLHAVHRLEFWGGFDMERAGGQNVVQYRGEILPVVDVRAALAQSASPGNDIQMVVCRHRGVSAGLLVDEVTDVIEADVDSFSGAARHGLLGSAIVGGQVTDLLDLEALMPSWHSPTPGSLGRLEAALYQSEPDKTEVSI